MENNEGLDYTVEMKSWKAERTALWKLCNVPPILFRLALFSIPIWFVCISWFVDTSDAPMSVRNTVFIANCLAALCAIWIVDCLTRIHGFTNPKTLLIYEIVKASAILFCTFLLTTVLLYKGYNESVVWYIPSFVGGFMLIQIAKLMQLSQVIKNYTIKTVLDVAKIDTSPVQDAADVGGGFIYYYVSYIQYQIEVDGVIYNNNPLLDSIIRHKFADYKNGKPLRIIYSTKNPKFNIIFQD